ncbi:uncharacterized protein CMU_042280 [Cryptosporidium muris RN66]|uniref:Uncharacterized protein n=1 Tax=Cryptosporidium muris (strain RN66) TaxID=441375 RepID=B6AAB4_CRYMR|nr:uncharacterized protein CMU_042280 [Cryptosporidium muris RN66]EEA05155.1 hypothetical protein, conserved [Cryptosporidium muris RN66]|eukprot:XP_002139504.1 hypothetical protein [Cryptosporidium muris RN66]
MELIRKWWYAFCILYKLQFTNHPITPFSIITPQISNLNLQSLEIRYYVFKIEKQPCNKISDIISKITFHINCQYNSRLSNYCNKPIIPIILVKKTSFYFSWLEMNLLKVYMDSEQICRKLDKRMMYVNCMHFKGVTSIIPALSEDQFMCKYFCIEFKPKCTLPLVCPNINLYIDLYKTVLTNIDAFGNHLDICNINNELLSIINFFEKMSDNLFLSQVTLQKVIKNKRLSLSNIYNPQKIYFSNNSDIINNELRKAIEISGNIFSNIRTGNYDSYIKIISDVILNNRELTNNLLYYQVYCAGQQPLAYYIYIYLLENKILNNTFMDMVRTEKLDIMALKDTLIADPHLLYDRCLVKMQRNFQIGLNILSNLINRKREYISEANKWLSNFFLGRSICDCSMIVSLYCSYQYNLYLQLSNFKLWKIINIPRNTSTDYNIYIWNRIVIIDISPKPENKIFHWKEQFANIIYKLQLISFD